MLEGRGPASAIVASRASTETWSILDNAEYVSIASGVDVL